MMGGGERQGIQWMILFKLFATVEHFSFDIKQSSGNLM